MPATLKPILSVLIVSSTLLLPAMAQPAGNPKGTAAPDSSDAAKPPAGGNRRSSADSADTGKLYTDKGPAKAREHTNRSPGTGTAGGLQKKTPEDGRQTDGASPQRGSQNRPATQSQ